MENEKEEIAKLVKKYGKVQSLMQYVNKETLKESYQKQPKGKAVGVDGVTKEEYGENLEANIESLIESMKKFAYKPYPVRRAYIPKESGKLRGLGIPSFEEIKSLLFFLLYKTFFFFYNDRVAITITDMIMKKITTILPQRIDSNL